jgi:PhnB protein
MTTPAIPTGFHSVTPNLTVDGGPGAIDFYRRAFGAEVVRRLDAGGKVMYAELRIGDSIITVNDEMPEFDSKAPDPSSPVPISLTIYCEDTDALYAQALEAGATQVREPKDAFFGDRVGTLHDPFGHKWAIATHLRDMTSEELEEAAQQAFA